MNVKKTTVTWRDRDTGETSKFHYWTATHYLSARVSSQLNDTLTDTEKKKVRDYERACREGRATEVSISSTPETT